MMQSRRMLLEIPTAPLPQVSGSLPSTRRKANSSNSVVAGISTFDPIVRWLFRDIRNPGNGLHILQTKFHGHQQTERCSMIHGKGMTVELCGEQGLWMAGRRQVDRDK